MMSACDGRHRSLRIDVGGHALHVKIEGVGTPVLILHGFTGRGETMGGVAAGLRARHTTVCVDLLGHGRSDAPVEGAAYGMERCVADLAAVLDALGVSRTHVLGYSMGGRVALAFGVRHPRRVAALVVVGASAGIADPAERRARRRADEGLARCIEAEGVARFVDGWMAQPLLATQQRLGPAAWTAARAQRLRNRAHGLAGSLRGLGVGAQAPLHGALTRLDRPVLCAVGEEDVKFRAIAEDLARLLPHGRIALIPRAGHAAHLENPQVFLPAVRSFLLEHETREAGAAEVSFPITERREQP